MSTFVLVHGAWQTAATWDLVAPILRSAGHQVHAPRLTGIDPETAVLTPEVGLATHISDVAQELERHNLHDVVLVGHSYAGMIIAGVAEQAESRLAALVYVDAFVPNHGDAAIEFMTATLRDSLRRAAAEEPDGFRLRASERKLDLWGLAPGAAREFVRARLHDFSIRCFEEPLQAPAGRARAVASAYIACVAPEYPARPIFAPFYQRAKDEGWPTGELPTGHDCHIERPEAFSHMLVSLTKAAVASQVHVSNRSEIWF